MLECICSRCKNLKIVESSQKGLKSGLELTDESIDNLDIAGEADDYACEFGFPAEECLDCTVDGCELTCDHFELDVPEDFTTVAYCAECGKELKLASNNDDGEVYCVSCFLKNM